MKQFSRFALTAVLLALTVSLFAACGQAIRLEYSNCISLEAEYDTDMFFRNDLSMTHAADPGAIWVSEAEHPEDGGYFYMYSTTLYHNFSAVRTKDFNTWEALGPVIDWSKNSVDRWCVKSLWAPECIYYQSPEEKASGERGKYYLFFTGGYSAQVLGDEYYIGVAVSESPKGPFVYYEGKNFLGEDLTAAYPTMDFNIDHRGTGKDGETYEYLSGVRPEGELTPSYNESRNNRHIKSPRSNYIIDVSPFIDDDGKIYMYLRGQYPYGTYSVPHLAVVEMHDILTPKYDTYTEVAYPGYRSKADKEAGKSWTVADDPAATYEKVTGLNEAPFVIRHKDVYYLTYAPTGYGSRVGYSVSVAVSSSPMGPFIKMKNEHGNPALGIEEHMDHMAGPGHHSFTRAGDEIFVFYHSLMNRATGDSNPRGIGIDRITFIDGALLNIPAAEYGIESDTGTFDMLYANGPTWSLQLAPEVTGAYKNVTDAAKITATNCDNNTVGFLNDGLFTAHDYAMHLEFSATGSTEITLTFDRPQDVNAIMLFNSYDYDYAFLCIDEIEFELSESPKSLKGKTTKKVSIYNLGLHPEYYDDDAAIIRPGAAAIARFNTLSVNKITVKISKPLNTIDSEGILRLSEIAVVGPNV